jgi:hypothetical protein
VSKLKRRTRRLLIGVLAGAGALFSSLAAIAPQFPGGIFGALSSLSWLAAVCLAARR